MNDFIFNVDLSTVYIILRRDFASADDETGVTSSPLGAGFYYSAEAASQAARQYCLREAAKRLDFMSESAVHGQKDGMYWGGCITREPERDRFEVRVRRLKARGGRWMCSSRESGLDTMRESRDMLVAVEEEDDGSYGKAEEARRSRYSSSLSSRLTGSRAGRLWESLRRR